jgi:hypothetical protein
LKEKKEQEGPGTCTMTRITSNFVRHLESELPCFEGTNTIVGPWKQLALPSQK